MGKLDAQEIPHGPGPFDDPGRLHGPGRLPQLGLGDPVKHEEIVSDLVQATMLKAHTAESEFRGSTEADLKAWLKDNSDQHARRSC